MPRFVPGILAGAVLLVVGAAALAPAGDPAADHLAERRGAFARLARGDSARAASDFERLLDVSPDDPALWLGLGRAREAAGSFRRAVDPYRAALEVGCRDPQDVCVAVARCYASAGLHGSAVDWIEEAVLRGFAPLDELRNDPRFAKLRDDPRWLRHVGETPGGGVEWVDGWRGDLAYLSDELQRLGAGVFEPAALAAAREALGEAAFELGDGTEALVPVRVQAALALLGDEVARVRRVSTRPAALELPLRFHRFPEGVFVVDAHHEHRAWIGSRVRNVGDEDVERVLERLAELASGAHDAVRRAAAVVLLERPAFLAVVGAGGSTSPVPFTLTTADGSERTVSFAAVAAPPDHATSRRRDLDVWGPSWERNRGPRGWGERGRRVERTRIDDVLHARYGQTGYVEELSEEERRGWSFRDRLQSLLATGNYEGVVLDLRGLAATNSDLDGDVLRILVAFEMGEDVGRVVVLVDRHTGPGAHRLLADLERLTNAVLVGESTGARPNMSGAAVALRLPYSGLRVDLPTALDQAGAPHDARAWFSPDVPVTATARAFFAGEDPALDAALAICAAH